MCASVMCIHAIKPKSNGWFCLPVAQDLRYMKKEDAGITVDSEIIEQVSTEFFT